MSYMGDDDYDYEHRRRPSAHRVRTDMRRSDNFLNPNFDNGGLYRTRSQGNGRVPIVNVYNELVQDGSYRNESSSRSPTSRLPYPASPEVRGRRDRLSPDLAEDLLDLTLENRRLRTRSRGRSDAGALNRRDELYELELRQRDREERIRAEYELKRVRDEAKRRVDEDAAKDERKRIIAEHEHKQREEKEFEEEEEKRIRDKIEREKREKKENDEREWNDFLRKKKEKEEEEKAKNKEAEEKFEEEMRRRLSRLGQFSPGQIDIMVRDEKVKQGYSKTTTTTTRTSNAMDVWRPNHAPVYAKIHRHYISIDTLTYYGVPYEYDRNDPNFIIILKEMDKYETEILFEHTKRLRAGATTKLLLEPAKDRPKYAWYRKRGRSSSRVKKLGILEVER